MYVGSEVHSNSGTGHSTAVPQSNRTAVLTAVSAFLNEFADPTSFAGSLVHIECACGAVLQVFPCGCMAVSDHVH